MKLSTKSKLFKWAYIMEAEYRIPDRTNVCRLFWRCFLLVPLQLLTMGFIIVAFSPLILWMWLKENGHLAWLYKHRVIVVPDFRLPSVPGGELRKLAWQRFKDWKSGVCTIVEIE